MHALSEDGWLLLLLLLSMQVLLGQDGSDMAAEVLPAQLLTRVDAAWAKWCRQHTAAAALPSLNASSLDGGSNSSSRSDSSSSSSGDRSAKPRGVSGAWWDAHLQLGACLSSCRYLSSSPSNSGSSGSSSSSGSSDPLQQLLHAGNGQRLRVQQIPLGEAAPAEEQAGHVLLGAFVLECTDFQQQQRQQQQQQQPQAVEGSVACQGLLQTATPLPIFTQSRVGSSSCSSSTSSSSSSSSSSSRVDGSRALLLVCADEAFSRGQASPLGGAVLQARLALTLWQQQQQQQQAGVEGSEEGEQQGSHVAVVDLPVYGLPVRSVDGLRALHV
jgi:hypothetical protein